jgi:hypothetical protein
MPSFLEKLRQEQARINSPNDPWRLRLERARAEELSMTASSELPRRPYLISLRFRNEVEEPGRAVVWRS